MLLLVNYVLHKLEAWAESFCSVRVSDKMLKKGQPPSESVPLHLFWREFGVSCVTTAITYFNICSRHIVNKKVLLRERKRHTACCVAVASACYSRGVLWVPPT